MIHPPHSSAAFFEAKYQRSADPWNFESSDYERRRYDAILNALEGSRYRSALEPGCSVGVLTEGLAPLCDQLLAFDFSPTAARAAEQRCRKFAHVRVSCLGLEDIPSFGGFDLIVLSEIGYYFTEIQWKKLTQRIVAEMPQRATLLAAHWTGSSEDHEISGDLVHDVLLANGHLSFKRGERCPGFRFDQWERL